MGGRGVFSFSRFYFWLYSYRYSSSRNASEELSNEDVKQLAEAIPTIMHQLSVSSLTTSTNSISTVINENSNKDLNHQSSSETIESESEKNKNNLKKVNEYTYESRYLTEFEHIGN